MDTPFDLSKNPNAPQFASKLENVEVVCGSSLNIEYPASTDKDDDPVLPPFTNTGTAFYFIEMTPKRMIISPPLKGCINEKKYPIKITLTDANPKPRSRKY